MPTRMLPGLLDIRSARQRRVTLVVLTALALALPVIARLLPRAAPVLAPPSVVSALLAAVALVAAAVALARGRDAHWTTADDVAWGGGLAALSMLGALGRAPVTVGTVLFALAALALAVRVPPPRLVVAACLSTVLGPLLRIAAGVPHGATWTSWVWPLVWVGIVVAVAHVLLARATHSLAFVLAEREALLSERRVAVRAGDRDRDRDRERSRDRDRDEVTAPARERTRTTPAPAEPAEIESAVEDVGWDGLVERLRLSLTSLCEAAGVAASVHAELRGLAPPSPKMRANVLRIAQEAANHALRDAGPSAIAVTLLRSDGGLVVEVRDDGAVGESVRARRGLAPLRGRVVPLGGSAELKRGDSGWVMRVKLPCEQLN